VGPINLIDGERLCELLIRYRLGVKQNRKKRWRVSRRYFKRLDMEHGSCAGEIETV
jgi:restriction endonuclease Mrr